MKRYCRVLTVIVSAALLLCGCGQEAGSEAAPDSGVPAEMPPAVPAESEEDIAQSLPQRR